MSNTEDRNSPDTSEDENDKSSNVEEETSKPSLVSAVLDKFKPSTWSTMSADSEVELITVPSRGSQFQKVEAKIHDTLAVSIDSVKRVQNPYLWGCYLLKKAECKERQPSTIETYLFHATAQRNVQSIVEGNLDWRRSSRTRYGQGVSFSPRASYANKYCNRMVGSRRALLMCRVLVGKSHDGCYITELPREGCCTTMGNGGSVYVKYYDNEFYPEYVAYYTY
ncbi:protein mono-ADP-ribosyltransferase PARP11-like [Periplaneta americana]|uniref:protein mono-ADP-ribosyltransferase PARP11-like n=1 Tax=Periplaneta americana TaxID=6978 RepID=UPI0037E92F46